MPKYLIIDGTFLDSDGTVKGPGQWIEMGADVAAQHASRLEPEYAHQTAQASAADAVGDTASHVNSTNQA